MRSTSFSRPRRRPAIGEPGVAPLDRPSPTPPSPPLAILPFTVGGTAYHHDGRFRGSGVQSGLAKLEQCLFGFSKVGLKFVRGAS